MNIRKDFQSVETYLHRLLELAKAFDQHETGDWVHLKNREDFDKSYQLEQSFRHTFEELYARGRETAGFMAERLPMFNYAKEYPTLADFVDSFDGGWVDEIDDSRIWLAEVEAMSNKVTPRSPWAVRRMIDVSNDQLRLLEVVRKTLDILKTSRLYRIEKGDISMDEDKNYGTVNIHHLRTGKVNIQSTDNSINTTIKSEKIFADIRQAIEGIHDKSGKTHLLRQVDEMQAEVGRPGFLARYQQFMQDAANHIAVIGPVLPALAQLIGM